MPRFLFYAGTAFCLFLALTSGAEAVCELQRGSVAFVALPANGGALWSIGVALLAGIATSMVFLRMVALLAARNLFAAFVAIVCVAGAVTTLVGVLFLQWRLTIASTKSVEGVHFAALLAFGFFLSMSLLSLRPYFRIQASRFLSALVFCPLPLFGLIVAHEAFVAVSAPRSAHERPLPERPGRRRSPFRRDRHVTGARARPLRPVPPAPTARSVAASRRRRFPVRAATRCSRAPRARRMPSSR